MRTKTLAILATTTYVLATASGCGTVSTGTAPHSASSSPTGASEDTRAQFITRSDAICTKLNQEADYKGEHLRELLAAFHSANDAQEIAESMIPEAIRKFAAFWRSGAAKLQAVPAPKEDATTVAKMEVDRSDIASDLENLASAAKNADPVGTEAAETALKETATSYDSLEQGYGFKVCGAEGS